MFFRNLRRRRTMLIAGAVLIIVIALGVFARRGDNVPLDVPFSEFLRGVDAGEIAQVAIGPEALDVVLRDGRRVRTIPPPGYIAANANLVPELVRRGVRIDVRPVTDPGAYNYGAIVLAFAFVGLVGFVVYRMTAGRIPSLESRARVVDASTQPITFADVAGADEAKDEVKEIVDFLRQPEKFSAIGGRIPKGVLLSGPPGTGKTLLARSIAGEANVPFLFANGSDFVEMYAGVGAARVRKLFRDARRHKACIVFIDELDAVGRSRGGNSLSHEEREQTLNQLLVEMDGFAPNQGIVLIAATNRQDILDPALMRPGRFDRHVVVGCPDVKGREAILRVHSRRISVAPEVDLRTIARGTPGFSGADLANLVNEAALLAARVGRELVTAAEFEAARDKVLMGVERRSLVMNQQERTTCAYHEAGHAVVAALLPHADPLHKVTIVPRGRALGVTMQLPEEDRYTHTREYLDAQIAILMGGRVVEELFLRQMTSGAGNDIERATEIARRMVCEFGMSSLGPLAFRTAGSPWDGERRAGISEATAQRVDDEIGVIVLRGYELARQVVEKNRAAVRALAEALLINESLEADELRDLLAAHGIVRPARAQ